MFKRSLLMVWCLLLVTGSTTLFSQIKETQQIIEGWIDTEQLISEESSQWNIEKAALLDLQDALKREISELDSKLAISEEQASGAAKQRSDLKVRKQKAEQTTQALFRSLQKIEGQLNEFFSFLPTPLAERLSPFREKLGSVPTKSRLTLRQRVETVVSLLQAIHIFHRSVTLSAKSSPSITINRENLWFYILVWESLISLMNPERFQVTVVPQAQDGNGLEETKLHRKLPRVYR